MTGAAWMAGISLAAWLGVAAVVDRSVSVAVFYGMLGPLLVACASWVVVARTHRRNAQAVTGLMIAGFGFKLVFFGAYVAVMLRALRLAPVPFAISFSGFFIALHLVEAALLRRLFSSHTRA
jgi:hypothetical protein